MPKVYRVDPIEAIIKGIEKHAKIEGATAVTGVRFKIGEFTGIKEEDFRERFKRYTRGTLLEKASLKISYFLASRIEVVSFDLE